MRARASWRSWPGESFRAASNNVAAISSRGNCFSESSAFEIIFPSPSPDRRGPSIVYPSTLQRVPTMLHREMLSHTDQALFVFSAQSPYFDHLKEDDKDGNAGEYSPHWVIPRPTIARSVNARKRPGLMERGPHPFAAWSCRSSFIFSRAFCANT
jgi:hypothetical protein